MTPRRPAKPAKPQTARKPAPARQKAAKRPARDEHGNAAGGPYPPDYEHAPAD